MKYLLNQMPDGEEKEKLKGYFDEGREAFAKLSPEEKEEWKQRYKADKEAWERMSWDERAEKVMTAKEAAKAAIGDPEPVRDRRSLKLFNIPEYKKNIVDVNDKFREIVALKDFDMKVQAKKEWDKEFEVDGSVKYDKDNPNPKAQEYLDSLGEREKEEAFVISRPLGDTPALPYDARYPNVNTTRRCTDSFLDYQRCIKLKGEDYKKCNYFQEVYRRICPSEWVAQWREQMREGIFPVDI